MLTTAASQFGLEDYRQYGVASELTGQASVYFPVLIGLAVIVIVLFFTVLGLRIWLRRRSRAHGASFERVVIMVSIPKFANQEDVKKKSTQEIQEQIDNAESVFAAVGGLKSQKGFVKWLTGRDDTISFEIIVHKGLIKFYFSVPRKMKDYVEEQLLARYSDAHIEEMEDFNLFSPAGTILGSYLTFKRPVGFPIKTYKKMEEDPLDALTNALSKVPKDAGVAIQYVVRSARPFWRKNGLSIARSMQQGIKMEQAIKGKKKGKNSILQDIISPEKTDQQKAPSEPYQMSPLEKEAIQGIEEKASKAGLSANVRVIVSSDDSGLAQQILNNVVSAFSQYNIYQFGNSFAKKVPRSLNKIVRDFIYRHFDDKYKIVLNAEEMASLWHLPLPTSDTPNIHWLGARRAAAPTTVPSEGEMYLGINEFRGVKKKCYIKREDRQRHMYIIGKSGSGKSVFMRNMINQDIKNGEGVCVVDPHGDLVESILGHIPKERVDDVIVFAPGDLDRPMGLNMLEAKGPDQMDFAVQEMIAIFYQLFPPEMIGPMFEHNMRNVMLTLMSDHENPGTIAEIPRMFSDQDFADKWIAKVKDPVVRAYWEKEMAKTSDFHKSEMLGYLISKVGRFVGNEMMRNIIGQSHSSFDFRDVMDNQKILLVNLSKGKTGEVNSSLLGMIIVSKLQMAAMSRADLPEEERKDFYLYMDEFQNFVTESIATILSEARKYRLDLIMAHQYLGQLVSEGGKTEVRDAVLGNVGSMFVCRVGVEDTEVLAKEYEPVFSGYDLVNADKFTWYVKMIVDNSTQKPFTLKGPWTDTGNEKLAESIKQLSRLKYGRDKAIVESEIMERTQFGATDTGPPPATGERAM